MFTRLLGVVLAVATVVVFSTGCTIAQPVDIPELSGTYVADVSGSPTLDIHKNGTFDFENIDRDWIGPDVEGSISGTGTWESPGKIYNTYPAYEVLFKAPPDVPGAITWIYVESPDRVFLWANVVDDTRIVFERQ